jgi:NAD(P)-dependent dehydrogenase (short-subunit alcohol dehydrogenase family)
MASNLKGKVALVTGGGSGIGKATAMAFAREGAKVAIADYVPEGGERTAKEIVAAGGEAIFIHADVAVGNQVEAMVNKIVQTWGRLDCAHNNAGIEGRMANVAECTEENFDRVIAINLKGVWLCMKHEIPQMLKHGGGTIVNTASVAGLVGFRGLVAYNASLEYAQQGIRVNAVCPGVIRTPMVARMLDASTLETYTEKDLEAAEPVGRMGKPEEIAEAVVWLCSDASSFVTGLPMAVDGGWIAQ